MKVYQIKYTHYGTLKYSYTDNFIDFYKLPTDIKTKTNLILEQKEFYEKVQQVQREKGL